MGNRTHQFIIPSFQALSGSDPSGGTADRKAFSSVVAPKLKNSKKLTSIFSYWSLVFRPPDLRSWRTAESESDSIKEEDDVIGVNMI